jgi:hypothetical protein
MTTQGRRLAAHGVWVLLTSLAFVGALMGLLASDSGLGVDWVGVGIVAGAGLIAFPLHIAIHEVGHLLMAWLAGLRVTSVRISMRHQSAVTVASAQPAPPIRMIAFALGGPLANLAFAALTWQLWRQALPTPVRLAAAFIAVIGVLVGVISLLPVRSAPSALDSDGLTVLRWALRPHLAAAAAQERAVRHGAGGSHSATADSVVSSDENPPASAASAVSPDADSVETDPVIAVNSPEGSTPVRP